MDDAFLASLDTLRERCGFPLIVSSGYRCPEYNERVSETGSDGPHTHGVAVDFAVSRLQAYTLLRAALDMGFKGIGVKQKGERGARFIHLDMMVDLRPNVWSY
jgi:uncharacterized protein YcbK (DUF882 family)